MLRVDGFIFEKVKDGIRVRRISNSEFESFISDEEWAAIERYCLHLYCRKFL